MSLIQSYTALKGEDIRFDKLHQEANGDPVWKKGDYGVETRIFPLFGIGGDSAHPELYGYCVERHNHNSGA